MKTTISSILGLVLGMGLVTTSLFANPTTVTSTHTDPYATVDVEIGKVYVPLGFNDTDRIQVTVAGWFNSTCYRIGPAALKVDEGQHAIVIQQQAYVYPGTCLAMFVPFSQTIDLGSMPAGTYSIQDYASKKVVGEVPVNRNLNPGGVGADASLYVPVTDAYIINDTQNQKNSLVLTGTFPNGCSGFQDVRVLYQDDVLVVLPLREQASGGTCTIAGQKFVKVIDLKTDLHGLYLLHVRSMNGQTLNRMVDFL